MTRMFGLMLNDATKLHRFLVQHRSFLSPPRTVTCDGYGIGYFQDDRPLLSKKRRIEGEEQTYDEIVSGISTDVLLVHARDATIGSWGTKNTHPFRYSPWLLAHVGTVEGIRENRDKILESMPKFIANNVKGDTDSEVLLHYFLGKLAETTRLDNPDLQVGEVAQSLKKAVKELVPLHQLSRGRPPGTFIATNGRLMVAYTLGIGLYMKVQDTQPPADEDTKEAVERAFRAIMLMTAVDEKPPEECELIPDGSLVSVDRSLEVMVV